MKKQNPTCAISGGKSNLVMHAFRNEEGEMIGWIFISQEISDKAENFNIVIKTEYSVKSLVKPELITGNVKLDNL